MHFEFNGGGFAGLEVTTLHIEMKLGEAVIHSQTASYPFVIMKRHCAEMVNQVAHDSRPMKITFTGEKDIELPNGDWITKPLKLIFANNAYLANFDLEK